MNKTIGSHPSLDLDTAGTNVVSHAGATLLVDAIRTTGLEQALSTTLSRWRRPTTIHNPAKILCDLAITLALGGDCLADITSLRTEPDLFGLVASDPTVSRLINTLARDADRVLAAVNTARAQVRATAWSQAGDDAPDHDTTTDHPLIIDRLGGGSPNACGQGCSRSPAGSPTMPDRFTYDWPVTHPTRLWSWPRTTGCADYRCWAERPDRSPRESVSRIGSGTRRPAPPTTGQIRQVRSLLRPLVVL